MWQFPQWFVNKSDTDGDSNVFGSDGDILPQFSAQDDAVVDAYQFDPTLTDYDMSTSTSLKRR